MILKLIQHHLTVSEWFTVSHNKHDGINGPDRGYKSYWKPCWKDNLTPFWTDAKFFDLELLQQWQSNQFQTFLLQYKSTKLITVWE